MNCPRCHKKLTEEVIVEILSCEEKPPVQVLICKNLTCQVVVFAPLFNWLTSDLKAVAK